MHPIVKLLNKPERLVLGLMSGTSCDGLDLALVRISGSGFETRFSLEYGHTFFYTSRQKNFLLDLLQKPSLSLLEISQLNFYLARIWSAFILKFLKKYNLSPSDIDLIGSHGQTIWHQPQTAPFADSSVASTWQTGDPSALAQFTQIPVVGDFRTADIALGGQGAPLIPYFDYLFFSRFNKNILSLNIGGISNLTAIPGDRDIKKLLAFDCGPGNMFMDQAVQFFFNEPYDTRGLYAKGGQMHKDFFDFLIHNDTFIRQKPPKSTGREQYN